MKTKLRVISISVITVLGVGVIQFIIGYICFTLFFKYYGIDSPVPLYKLPLMQIGSIPFLLAMLLSYPAFLKKCDNAKGVKILYGFISFLLLLYIYLNNFVEYRYYTIAFGMVLNLVGIYFRKYMYNCRLILSALSLVLMISLFTSVNTYSRLRYNIVNHNCETYAITYLISENAYLLRAEIEPNTDNQSDGLIIRLYRGEYIVVNIFEDNILVDNITAFSRAILED